MVALKDLDGQLLVFGENVSVNSTQRGDQTHNLLGVVGEVGFMLARSGTVNKKPSRQR